MSVIPIFLKYIFVVVSNPLMDKVVLQYSSHNASNIHVYWRLRLFITKELCLLLSNSKVNPHRLPSLSWHFLTFRPTCTSYTANKLGIITKVRRYITPLQILLPIPTNPIMYGILLSSLGRVVNTSLPYWTLWRNMRWYVWINSVILFNFGNKTWAEILD